MASDPEIAATRVGRCHTDRVLLDELAPGNRLRNSTGPSVADSQAVVPSGRSPALPSTSSIIVAVYPRSIERLSKGSRRLARVTERV